MITTDNFWKLVQYLKDGTYSNNTPESTLRLVADSEKQVTTNFFKNTLDQTSFNKDDYLKLRDFFIDWYASLRTIITIQKNASDAFSLTNFQINELFKSFGYTPSIDIIPLNAKSSFFLDLVNFYKVKGTPNTIANVLEYYGFSDTNINEYWLLKNGNDQLVFRPENIITSSTYDPLIISKHDVHYDVMVNNDPHWYYTYQQIYDTIDTNLIRLPSKSPYFSLTTNFYLNRLSSALAILSKVIRDEYVRFITGQPLLQNLLIKNLGVLTSILEVYIATCYSFTKIFGHSDILSSQFLNLFSYNLDIPYLNSLTGEPPSPTGLADIQKTYLDEILKRPVTRDEQKSRIIALDEIWSYPTESHYLQGVDDTGTLLQLLNPDLKSLCDLKIDINDQKTLMYSLVSTLDHWIRTNIATDTPSIVISLLGFGYEDEIKQIIEFFKPYRARLAFIDEIYVIKDPLHESVVVEETQQTIIYEYKFEHPTPYCLERVGLDLNCLFDVGISDDLLYQMTITQSTSDFLRTTDGMDDGGLVDSHYIYDLVFENYSDKFYETLNIIDKHVDSVYQIQHEHSDLDSGTLFDVGITNDKVVFIIQQNSLEFLRTENELDKGGLFDNHYIYDFTFEKIIETFKEIIISKDDICHQLVYEITLDKQTPYCSDPKYLDSGSLFDVGITDDKVISIITENTFEKLRTSSELCDGGLFDNHYIYDFTYELIKELIHDNALSSDILWKSDVINIYDHPNHSGGIDFEFDNGFHFDLSLCDDNSSIIIENILTDKFKYDKLLDSGNDFDNCTIYEINDTNISDSVLDTLIFRDDVTIRDELPPSGTVCRIYSRVTAILTVGILESPSSATCEIQSNVAGDLVVGLVEILSSSNITTSSTGALLVIGVNEVLSSTSIISVIINADLTGGSVSFVGVSGVTFDHNGDPKFI